MSAPAPVPEAHPGRVQSLRFQEVDMMASARAGGHLEFIPIEPGKVGGWVSRIEFDGSDIRRLIHAPFLIHEAIPPDHLALNLQVRPVGGLTLNSDAFDTSTLAILPEGAAVHAIRPAEHDRIGLALFAQEFDRLLEVCGARTFPWRRHSRTPLPCSISSSAIQCAFLIALRWAVEEFATCLACGACVASCLAGKSRHSHHFIGRRLARA